MDQKQNILRLVLASDATGDTVSAASAAVTSQFEALDVRVKRFRFVRSQAAVTSVLSAIDHQTDVVLYTLSDRDHADQVALHCQAVGAKGFALLDPLFQAVADVTKQKPELKPGGQYALNTQYFDRVAAIDYAISHDDGLSSSYLDQADVLVFGISRTSKTPTCIYLAYQGIRAANIPLVLNQPLPADILARLKSGMRAVGLVASVARLAQVRQNRLLALGQGSLDDYTDRGYIQEELVAARLFFEKYKIPVIDVTRRSIEETAAAIREQVLDQNE
ncbi:MAG: pyruvate, water dikinase regulatory protein [Pseudomonadota bacterium]